MHRSNGHSLPKPRRMAFSRAAAIHTLSDVLKFLASKSSYNAENHCSGWLELNTEMHAKGLQILPGKDLSEVVRSVEKAFVNYRAGDVGLLIVFAKRPLLPPGMPIYPSINDLLQTADLQARLRGYRLQLVDCLLISGATRFSFRKRGLLA